MKRFLFVADNVLFESTQELPYRGFMGRLKTKLHHHLIMLNLCRQPIHQTIFQSKYDIITICTGGVRLAFAIDNKGDKPLFNKNSSLAQIHVRIHGSRRKAQFIQTNTCIFVFGEILIRSLRLGFELRIENQGQDFWNGTHSCRIPAAVLWRGIQYCQLAAELQPARFSTQRPRNKTLTPRYNIYLS